MQADMSPFARALTEGAGLVNAGIALDCPEPVVAFVEHATVYLQVADMAAASAWAALIGAPIRTVPVDADTVAHYAESDVLGQRVHVFCHQPANGRMGALR